jgi:two-component system CheB/CheR fusion protein
MAKAVQARLAALARAHELTLPDLDQGAEGTERATTLHALVQTIVSPHLDPEGEEDERVVVQGSDVPVGGRAATSLALLLHELATNAAKHGALSSPIGRVRLSWFVDDDELLVHWEEQGGPSLDGPPAGEGFGSLLVRRTVTGQFGGRMSHDWKREGLILHLSLPLERLTK